MVDALINRIAVSINFVVRSNNSFGNNSLCFMSNKTINCNIWNINKIKTFWCKPLNTINSII